MCALRCQLVMSEDFFPVPAFKPNEALVALKRQLRDLHSLTERANKFEWHGKSVLELAVVDQAVIARLAKRPAHSPQWVVHTLKASADVRRFMDDLKQLLVRWSDE